ncbi:MAG: 23S rRNA (uracil(1939)-C(5))-methyltransferase RlmD, partial [Pseudomonadota bacterium]
DRVLVRIVRKKKDYAEARIIDLLEPSPERIQPPCPYHGVCGGCQWQHIRYDCQTGYKKAHILESLTRIGGLADVPVHDVLPSEKIYGYRNKMEFSFSGHPWLTPQEMACPKSGSGFALGLHVPGTYHKVIDMEACLLQGETGNRILREVKRYAKGSDLPVYDLKAHSGFWRFLTIRCAPSSDEWMVNLITTEEGGDALETLARSLSREFNNVKTVVNNISGRWAAIAIGERERILSGEGVIMDRIGPFTFRISANSFFQTNSFNAATLYRTIVDYAELKGSETVLDLYSGTGTIPHFLSRRASMVIGMEITESAVLDARTNCRINGIDNCRFVQGDIKERLPDLGVKPDVLIIDPPRAGMHKKVLKEVLEMGVNRVVYISCNPPTMARDLALMRESYEVVEIQPVDMFPQTYHVEVIGKLIRRKKTGDKVLTKFPDQIE